mgnify:FL=1|jgi:hypothetical protein
MAWLLAIICKETVRMDTSKRIPGVYTVGCNGRGWVCPFVSRGFGGLSGGLGTIEQGLTVAWTRISECR